jgi:hypothetical protein
MRAVVMTVSGEATMPKGALQEFFQKLNNSAGTPAANRPANGVVDVG